MIDDSETAPVTEPEARAAYLAMPGRRSTEAVHKKFTKEGRKTLSLRTFKKWCAKHNWKRLAQEHDEKIATGAANELVKDATEKAVTRAMQFDVLATESLEKAIDGLANIDPKTLRVADIRALYEVGERAARMFELLEGRATSRGDTLTRSKLDELLGEMRDDLEDRLDDAKTVH